jgi:peptidyl-tRNA hydrolase, PTH1 family
MEYSIKNIKAIIGLGNPGTKYYKTRHSIGFRVLDKIAQDYNVNWSSTDLMEHTSISFSVDGLLQPIILIKPLTYMNESGKVVPFLQKKGIKPENILVVHDELEKAFGKISLKFAGSARGHNGLRSIISFMGYNFWRFRFGIGRPENKMDVSNFVLTKFSVQDEENLENLLQESTQKIFQE